MASVNKVIILGNLGQDPETRYMPNGDAVTNISVATSRKWKDKANGETKEETEWHRITFFGRQAEVAGEYLVKGSKVHVIGRLRTEKWQDKETGKDRYATKIIAEELTLIDSKRKEGESGGGREERGGDQPRERATASGTTSRQAPAKKPAGKFDDMEDDIPF